MFSYSPVFETALQDSAPVRMRGQTANIITDIRKEAELVRIHTVDKFLNHLWHGQINRRQVHHTYMICMRVRDTFEDMGTKDVNYLALLVHRNTVDSLE